MNGTRHDDGNAQIRTEVTRELTVLPRSHPTQTGRIAVPGHRRDVHHYNPRQGASQRCWQQVLISSANSWTIPRDKLIRPHAKLNLLNDYCFLRTRFFYEFVVIIADTMNNLLYKFGLRNQEKNC
jgi:hypothetical protein